MGEVSQYIPHKVKSPQNSILLSDLCHQVCEHHANDFLGDFSKLAPI